MKTPNSLMRALALVLLLPFGGMAIAGGVLVGTMGWTMLSLILITVGGMGWSGSLAATVVLGDLANEKEKDEQAKP